MTYIRFCFVLVVSAAAAAGAVLVVSVAAAGGSAESGQRHNYADALWKSVIFFEGQRSGKLPASQRMTWRKDSALKDGQSAGVDLVGGYYDAGDNVKFGFPMAFTTTMLSWSIIEFGTEMGPEIEHAMEAVRWATDYLLKATAEPNKVYVQVGVPLNDHNCWERPEDMDTLRIAFAVDTQHPGSEVAAETAAALAAASMVFKSSDPQYSQTLLNRAITVFQFADTYQGSYNTSLYDVVCPFYCDFNGYKDELIWGAAWIYKASNSTEHWDYVAKNIQEYLGYSLEFGWDSKHAGVYVLLYEDFLNSQSQDLVGLHQKGDEFACTVLPESPTKTVRYSPGGLLFKVGSCNIQNSVALSFLLLTLSRHLANFNLQVRCDNISVNPPRLVELAKSQVDYILGDNPLQMSYMVGYSMKFPQRIHHRGSSLPSIDQHPEKIACKDGTPYYVSESPNPNLLIGAVVGGPSDNDTYLDFRPMASQSEPTTYINAAMVGILAYFNAHGQ